MTHCSQIIKHVKNTCNSEKASLASSLRAKAAQNVTNAITPIKTALDTEKTANAKCKQEFASSQNNLDKATAEIQDLKETVADHTAKKVEHNSALGIHNSKVEALLIAKENAFGTHVSSKDAMYAKCVNEMASLVETISQDGGVLIEGYQYNAEQHLPVIQAACGSHNVTLDLIENPLAGLATADTLEF